MNNHQPTDQELAQLLKEKAAGLKLSTGEKQALRYSLMEKIAIIDVTKSTSQGYRWWKYQLSFKGVTMPFLPILIAILLAGGAGTAALANNAKPGDALYPVDQWLERVQTKLAVSESTRAELYAKFSAERLQELEDIDSVDPTELSDAAKALWEEHQQEAIDRLGKSIEQVTALQEKFQEKLAAATNDSEKAAFQRVLDNLARVKARRDERLQQLSDQTFPGLGRLPIIEELKKWQEIAKDEREQIREQIKNEFENQREQAKSHREGTKLNDDSTSTSDSLESSSDKDESEDEDESDHSGEESKKPSTGVTSQTLEFRIPVDENGNIRVDLIDSDHDGIPDEDDNQPNWPPHTM